MQGVFGKSKDTRPCDGCGMSLPFKSNKKMKASTIRGQFLCKTCAKVYTSCIIILLVLLKFNVPILYFKCFFIIIIIVILIPHNYMHCFLVNKIKTFLWHMQEGLEPFRQWELGEAIYYLFTAMEFCSSFFFNVMVNCYSFIGCLPSLD